MNIKSSPGFKLDFACKKPYIKIIYKNFNKTIFLPPGLQDEQYQNLFMELASSCNSMVDIAYQEGKDHLAEKAKHVMDHILIG